MTANNRVKSLNPHTMDFSEVSFLHLLVFPRNVWNAKKRLQLSSSESEIHTAGKARNIQLFYFHLLWNCQTDDDVPQTEDWFAMTDRQTDRFNVCKEAFSGYWCTENTLMQTKSHTDMLLQFTHLLLITCDLAYNSQSTMLQPVCDAPADYSGGSWLRKFENHWATWTLHVPLNTPHTTVMKSKRFKQAVKQHELPVLSFCWSITGFYVVSGIERWCWRPDFHFWSLSSTYSKHLISQIYLFF